MQKLISIIALIISACSSAKEMALEKGDVQFWKISETKNASIVSLEISGLAFHSALAVSRMSKRIHGNSLEVVVYLVPSKKGLSGSFSYKIVVPDSVNSVHFGNERTLIWKRGVGPV